jgi:hypothetical protein
MLLLTALLALSSSVLAFPFSGETDRDVTFKSSVFEKLAKPPAGWEKDESVVFNKDGSSVRLRIHLVQQGMNDFHDLALKVSDCSISPEPRWGFASCSSLLAMSRRGRFA